MAKPSPVTLVTGASTGIGHAIAVHLARCGHRVFAGMRAPAGGDIMGRKEAVGLAAMAATEDISIVPLVLEVTDEHSCADAVARIEEAVGPIDVLVNNARLMNVLHCADQVTAHSGHHARDLLDGGASVQVAALHEMLKSDRRIDIVQERQQEMLPADFLFCCITQGDDGCVRSDVHECLALARQRELLFMQHKF